MGELFGLFSKTTRGKWEEYCVNDTDDVLSFKVSIFFNLALQTKTKTWKSLCRL
jgi:hypothetical protein